MYRDKFSSHFNGLHQEPFWKSWFDSEKLAEGRAESFYLDVVTFLIIMEVWCSF